MIGIEKIASHIPEYRLNNMERYQHFDVTESFILNKLGMEKIAIKDESQDTSDLCCRAVEALQQSGPFEISEIDCLVVCTQNPDRFGLPHTSAIVHHKLGLSSDCAAFDISLGCSGYVYSLSVIHSFMMANDLNKGLLITCDPYSKVIDWKDKTTSMLFGDASTVTLLGDNPEWKIGKAVFGSKGKDWPAIRINAHRKLTMQGRTVFNFAAVTIPDNIERTLKKNNIAKEEVDLFILHQASKYILDLLRKRLGLSDQKLPFCAADYGNTVSSSIPIILEDGAKRAETILICGFGVGLSWGSLVLTKATKGV